MKKTFAIILLTAAAVTATAQEFFGIANHLGAGLSVGTEGIGINVATNFTKWCDVGLGVNFMPGIKIGADVNVNEFRVDEGYVIPAHTARIKANMARTTVDLKASVYPFASLGSSFFVTVGASFGGSRIMKLHGHSDEIQNAYVEHPEIEGNIHATLDKYDLEFDRNGDIDGKVKVKGFRPYLGLGFGRQIPKSRLGFRFELGCQFMGHMKIYQGEQQINELASEHTNSGLAKFIDKFTVYPVLKFTLTGRIL